MAQFLLVGQFSFIIDMLRFLFATSLGHWLAPSHSNAVLWAPWSLTCLVMSQA